MLGYFIAKRRICNIYLPIGEKTKIKVCKFQKGLNQYFCVILAVITVEAKDTIYVCNLYIQGVSEITIQKLLVSSLTEMHYMT